MNKQHLLDTVISLLTSEYQTAKLAATSAHETATHNETVAENKYDTFGLEASYLAHGQAQRVGELEDALQVLRSMNLKEYSEQDAIGIGAYVVLENDLSDTMNVFLAPEAGGTKFNLEHRQIVVVTPISPIGALLKDKYIDDEIQLTTGGTKSNYLITYIC